MGFRLWQIQSRLSEGQTMVLLLALANLPIWGGWQGLSPPPDGELTNLKPAPAQPHCDRLHDLKTERFPAHRHRKENEDGT